jgi:hypothetical protein
MFNDGMGLLGPLLNKFRCQKSFATPDVTMLD